MTNRGQKPGLQLEIPGVFFLVFFLGLRVHLQPRKGLPVQYLSNLPVKTGGAPQGAHGQRLSKRSKVSVSGWADG
eukprot:921235-Pyramimonas_sp.AAC.1